MVGAGEGRGAKPNMIAVLLRREEFGETHRGTSCDNKDRDWSDALTSSECLGPQKVEKQGMISL